MSTVSRRNKAVAAKKAQAMLTLPVEDEPEPTPNGRNGAKKTTAKTLLDAKPIYADLSHVRDYTFTDHAAQQMGARNISPAEVLSAIANPDTTRQPNTGRGHNPNTKTLTRGDVQVVIDTLERCVVTVIDINEKERTGPRIPQVANLVVPSEMPPVLPGLDVKVGRGLPKEVPDNDDTRWVFGKHLRKDVRFMDISPVLARALLERNVRNRHKRPGDVDDWSNEMANGRWRETHQGVALARDGVILDGQHRLEAIVDSGVTINLLVVVGLDPEVFSVIDTGRKRNSADALGMVGETNLTQLAAITRACYDYDYMLANGRSTSRRRVHHDVLLAYRVGKEKALSDAAKFSQSVRNFGLKVNKTAAGTAFFLLKRDVDNQDLVDDFLEQVRTGENLKTTDPVYALRRYISKDITPNKDRHLAVILKAWALYVQGRGATTLSWRTDEEMPAVYRGRGDR